MIPRNYSFFRTIIYGEILLILITIIGTYVLYFIFIMRKKTKILRSAEIETYLIKLNNNIKPLIFDKKWNKLSCLIKAIQSPSIKVIPPTTTWLEKKKEFIINHILPLARKEAQKKGWYANFLAAKAFNLYANDQDEALIKHLLNSNYNTVALEANSAVANVPTKGLINQVITQVSQKRRKSYDLYLHVFTKLVDGTKFIVMERLEQEHDPYTRDICYRILLKFSAEKPPSIAFEDAYASTINLSLSAIKYITYTQKELALPFLIKLLDHAPWERKVVIAKSLGKIKDPRSIDSLVNLINDSNRWVRINAIYALKDIGKEGLNKLKELCNSKNSLGTTEIEYVLQEASK